jgi:hypothetical protein
MMPFPLKLDRLPALTASKFLLQIYVYQIKTVKFTLLYLLIAYHFKMLIAPAHAIALAAPPDAVQNTAQFVYVQDILLIANDPNHPIHSCFKKYGYDSIHDLVAMTAKDVEVLE